LIQGLQVALHDTCRSRLLRLHHHDTHFLATTDAGKQTCGNTTLMRSKIAPLSALAALPHTSSRPTVTARTRRNNTYHGCGHGVEGGWRGSADGVCVGTISRRLRTSRFLSRRHHQQQGTPRNSNVNWSSSPERGQTGSQTWRQWLWPRMLQHLKHL
jgi:hypothetical protein